MNTKPPFYIIHYARVIINSEIENNKERQMQFFCPKKPKRPQKYAKKKIF